jgi:hypothetical protein
LLPGGHPDLANQELRLAIIYQEKMTPAESPLSLPLNLLEARCASETLRFFQHIQSDTSYCYEIFRRALVERDQAAWQSIDTVYAAQISRWVRKHRGFAACGEDEAYFANRALEKFWRAIKPERFSSFPALEHLLTYLQMCVHSAISDHVRQMRQRELERQAVTSHANGLVLHSPEVDFDTRARAKMVLEQITGLMQDEKEKIVLQASFVLGLKPAEILQYAPATFENIREIYRIKENILARLRRDPELTRLSGLDTE